MYARIIVVLSVLVSLLIVPAVALSGNKMYYFNPRPPQVGSKPPYDAGIRAQWQGYFLKSGIWWKHNGGRLQRAETPPKKPTQ